MMHLTSNQRQLLAEVGITCWQAKQSIHPFFQDLTCKLEFATQAKIRCKLFCIVPMREAGEVNEKMLSGMLSVLEINSDNICRLNVVGDDADIIDYAKSFYPEHILVFANKIQLQVQAEAEQHIHIQAKQHNITYVHSTQQLDKHPNLKQQAYQILLTLKQRLKPSD